MRPGAALALAAATAAALAACKHGSPRTASPTVIQGRPEPRIAEPTGRPAPATQPSRAGSGAPDASGAPDPVAGMSDAQFDALMQQMMSFMTAFADAIANNASDCGRMAGAIHALIDTHRAMIADMQRFRDSASWTTRIQAWTSAHQADMNALMNRMMGGMSKCMNDPQVQAELKRLEP